MAVHVYVQTNEIACAAASGKSAAAFPDPCFSPPVPPPTGAPLPYPNTCYAKHITKGSKTVLVRGSTIALEKKAYFSKSEGDIGATQALKKGVVSGKIDGRAYFQSWAADVKVEGKGVACHFDMVSHNHGSPMNTPLFPYLSQTLPGKHDCSSAKDDINEACKDTETKTGLDGKPEYNKKWQNSHCLKTELPSTAGAKEKADRVKLLKNILKLRGKLKDQGLRIMMTRGRKGAPSLGERHADLQTQWASSNACLKARKCQLVPYGVPYGSRSKTHSKTVAGCCASQTGHHLIPHATMAAAGCTNKYSHETAPTVCVEGATLSHGSHGAMHDAWDAMVNKNAGGRVSLEELIRRATATHSEIFSSSCEACIAAQLKVYFRDTCSNLKGSNGIEPLLSSGKSYEP